MVQDNLFSFMLYTKVMKKYTEMYKYLKIFFFANCIVSLNHRISGCSILHR